MVNRLAIRILTVKARRAGNRKAVEALNAIQKDQELRCLVDDYLSSEFYGSPMDLLNWIKENWEEILKAIIMLVDLFSED